MLVPALLAAGCGSGFEAAAAGDAAETRTVEHSASTTGGLPNLQRIVSTTAQNALLPLFVEATWARMDGYVDVLEEHLLPARDDGRTSPVRYAYRPNGSGSAAWVSRASRRSPSR